MKILNGGFVAAMAFAVAASFTSSASADLLSDGGFEDNPNAAWVTFGANVFADEVAPGIDGAFEGNESMKMFGNFPGDGSVNYTGAFQDVAVDGVGLSVGDLVQMSGYIAQLTGDNLQVPNFAFMEITFVDTSPGGLGEFGFGSNTTANLDNTSPSDSWEFFTTAGVFVPVEADFVRAKAVFVQESDAGGAAWFDNVSLVKLTIPEPSSMTVLGLGLIGLVLRRKRS